LKLEAIHTEHVQQAATQVDQQGVPKDFVWSQYYVVIDEKEYPFKYLVKTAYELATTQTIHFQASESHREYIEELGFEIRFYENGYNFFTQEELAFYHSIAQKDYRKNNPNQKYYGQKLYPIIAKANYWAEQLIIEGFQLRRDGNWLTGHTARIAPYIWPRIYKGEDKDIFFNIEVNGLDQFIGYKLDGYYETTKAMPEYKIKLLEEYKEQINWEWPTIPFDQLHKYNWDKLLAESKNYVQRYLQHHDRLKKTFSKETKIARITWNTNQWVKPSGLSGKSTNASHESEHGFGFEEWLFDGDKVIDGIKYGFLEPIEMHRSKYEGKIFDLFLYTRNCKTKQSYWVTTLKNVEVLMPEEAEEVLNYYKKKGWYDEMKADLYNLNLDSNQIDTWALTIFNIKFDASQISEVPIEYIPVVNDNDIPSLRYKLLNISHDVQEKYEKANKKGFSFETSGSTNSELESSGVRRSIQREIELELKHNMVQAKFLKYLQSKHGKSNVRRECKAFGASRIDIVRKTKTGGYVFYEIKTYNSLKSSIREGIGQLLEYSLYPNVNQAEKIVLVSHVSPSEEIIQYLTNIKNFISLPFSYIHFDTDKNEIISEI